MKILKVREWLFDRANQDVVDGARERLVQKALTKGLVVNPKTGLVQFREFMSYLNIKISSDRISIE